MFGQAAAILKREGVEHSSSTTEEPPSGRPAHAKDAFAALAGLARLLLALGVWPLSLRGTQLTSGLLTLTLTLTLTYVQTICALSAAAPGMACLLANERDGRSKKKTGFPEGVSL